MKENSFLDHAADVAFAELERLGGDPARLPEPLETVAVIYGVNGVIGNGGFEYLFESNFPFQPPYERFIECYRRIGAFECAEAFARAVAAFPFVNPHLHEEMRRACIEAWDNDPASPLAPESTRLLQAYDEIWELLTRYAERNEDAFKLAGG